MSESRAGGHLQTREEWVISLQRYLATNFLPRFIDDPYLIRDYVTPEVFHFWERAFIHQSVNLNDGPSGNYEALETIGDKLLDGAFFHYLNALYPNLPNSTISDLKTQYLEKSYMGKVGHILGFGKYIRIDRDVRIIHGTKEDIYESVSAALYYVAERVEQLRNPQKYQGTDLNFPNGAGARTLYLFVSYVYKNVSLDPENPTNNPRGTIKDIFEMMGWDKAKNNDNPRYIRSQLSVVEGVKSYHVQIILTPEAVEYFVQHKGLQYQQGKIYMLGEGTNIAKKQAIKIASTQAVDVFASFQIDREFAKNQRNLRVSTLSETATGDSEMQSRAYNKAMQAGYVEIYVFRPKGGQNSAGNLYMLVGVRPDGTKDPLSRHLIPANYDKKNQPSPDFIVYEKYLSGPTVCQP